MMNLVLKRTYLMNGTNGCIYHNDVLICRTIELPWRENKQSVSCIPEGIYKLRKRYSTKFNWHMEIIGVINRSIILIHPANNAAKELKGCIAPVTSLIGSGVGTDSRKAFNKLRNLVFKSLEANEEVQLIINS